MICTGKYGDVPAIPKFPGNKGPEIFKGKVMHTIDYCKLNETESTELMKGKKVVVFGYKKSAIDLAVECAEANQGIFLGNFLSQICGLIFDAAWNFLSNVDAQTWTWYLF